MSELEQIPDIETKFVTNVYNNIADHFDQTRQYRWKWIDEFVNSLTKTSTIYDIGCGTGRNMTGYTTDLHHTFIGVDSCPKFVTMCRDKGLTCIESSMTALPCEDSTADVILSIASFHHLSTEERRIASLMEMKRVLKDDGRILLSVWSKHQPKKSRRVFETYGDVMVEWNKQGTMFRRYYYIFQMEEIKKLFDTCGLGITSHTWDFGNEVFVLHKI